MLGQHRQVIFKEDMFDVIDNAHRNGHRHRGYKGTFNKINATYCNIPREVVHKYVNMCQFCQKAHARFVPTNLRNSGHKAKKKLDNLPKRKEIEMAFLTRCQIDILDMQSLPDVDGQFSYIGHFLDHHTKYNVLFPLKRTDALYVARKLCRYVFGHFGLPRIMHSNLGRKYIDELISWILQFWSTDAQILNGNPRLKKMNAILQQRQKTIMILIETIRAKQNDTSSWSVWLPGIQYSLNTNQFEAESPPAYDVVFNRRPKVYTYAPSTKDIPREEEVLGEDELEESGLNEVITVSVSDLIQTGADPLLISQLSSDSTGLDSSKENMDERGLKETAVLSSELLSTATFGGIPLSLSDQYTIIGTTLGVDAHTIQIPVVNLGNGTLSIDSANEQGNSIHRTMSVQNYETMNSPSVNKNLLSAANENDDNSLQLGSDNVNNSIDLASENVSDSLQLSNEGVTNTLELSNLAMDVDSNSETQSSEQNEKKAIDSKQNGNVRFSIGVIRTDSINSLENDIDVDVVHDDEY